MNGGRKRFPKPFRSMSYHLSLSLSAVVLNTSPRGLAALCPGWVPSLKHFAERSEELVKRPRPPDPIQISSNLGGKGWKRMENYIILYIKQESRMEKYGKHLDHCRSVRIVATCGNWHHWPIQWRCAFLFKKTVQIKCAQKQDSLKMFKVPLPWNGWTIELNPLNPANPITKWSSMSSQEAGNQSICIKSCAALPASAKLRALVNFGYSNVPWWGKPSMSEYENYK